MMVAKDYRKKADDALQGRGGVAIGTGLVAILLGIEPQMSDGSILSGLSSIYEQSGWKIDSSDWRIDITICLLFIAAIAIIVTWLVVAFIIGGAIKLGYVRFNKNLILNQSPQFKDIFSRFNLFVEGFGLRLLVLLYTWLWTMLFIIPGIIARYSYMLAPYILEENPDMSINKAIKYSKLMMEGNKWKLFCLQISFIGWELLCLLTCGIGFLWLIPYYYAAEAAFFIEVSDEFRTGRKPSNREDRNNGVQKYEDPTKYYEE